MIKTSFVKCFEQDFQQVKDIRKTVFQKEQGVNVNEDIDSFDQDNKTDYVLVFNDDKPVGTGRIIYLDDGVKLGRIAVLKECRGLGLGKIIVKSLVEKAFDNGENIVKINSQNHAIGFYERLGFKICGQELVEIGIKHTPMCVTRESFKGE